MRYLLLLIFLSGCLTLPNKPECFQDGLETGKCAYPVSGDDFIVDNSGQHNYTLDGHNWTLDELKKYSLITPPETYAADQEFFINWCHQNKKNCSVQDISNAFKEFEERLPDHLQQHINAWKLQ